MFVVASVLCSLALANAAVGPDLTITGLERSAPVVQAPASGSEPQDRPEEPPRDRGLILELLAGKKLYNCACGRPNRNSRIIGGEAADIHEFPWFAEIMALGVLAGSGALINDRYIITAATTVKGMTPYDVRVTLGAHDRCVLDTTSARLSVVDIRIHEDYDVPTKANDIALVRLGNPVKFQREISPVCLAGSISTFRGQVATILSWGQDDVFAGGGGDGGDEGGDNGGGEDGGGEDGGGEDGAGEDGGGEDGGGEDGGGEDGGGEDGDGEDGDGEDGDGEDGDGEDGDGEDGDGEDEGGDDVDDGDKKKKKKKQKRRKTQKHRTERQSTAGDDAVVNCRPRKVGLPVLERVQCARAVDGLLFTPDKGCVGILNVRSIICATDAGGPVQFRGHSGFYELIGVLSGSNDCVGSTTTTGPALFSRIGQYLRWIALNTRDAYYCSG